MSASVATKLESTAPAAPTHAADASQLPIACKRVIELLGRAGVPFSVKLLPARNYTTEELAERCSCDINAIAKTTVYRGKTSKKPYLLMHTASTRVDERILSSLVGENVQRAEPEFVQRLTGYPVNAIPPAGHANRTPVLMDSRLLRFGKIWCPGGMPNVVLSVATLVLARAIAARLVRFE